MDNLTHTLVGVTMANAGLKQRFGRGTIWVLAIASNLTDLDVLGGFFFDGPSFLYRRMLTHSILGVPLLALGFGYLFHRLFKNLSFRTATFLCLLGMGVHVLFDLVNSYGVVLLYPFSRRRFELAWIFIIDLAVWTILLLPLLLCWIRSRATTLESLSKIALRTLAMYLMACGILRWQAGRHLGAWIAERPEPASFAYVFPEALGPHRFRGVARFGDAYHTAVLHPLGGRPDTGPVFPTRDASLDVVAIQQTRLGRGVRWFAKAPVWQPAGRTPAGQEWIAADLRFSSLVLNRGNPFVFVFRVGPEGIQGLGLQDRPLQRK